LAALLASGCNKLGIINADLVFEPSPAWATSLPEAIGPSMLAAHRYDTSSLFDGALSKYYVGLDCLFFDSKTATDFTAEAGNLAMGLPWWDYWLPAVCQIHGRDVKILDRPGCAHLLHPQGYAEDLLLRFSTDFADFVLEKANRLTPHPPVVAMLLDRSREISALRQQRDATSQMKSAIKDRFDQSVAEWRRQQLSQVIRFETLDDGGAGNSQEELTPSTVFRHAGKRMQAGEALVQAKCDQLNGNLVKARQILEAALNLTPGDREVLTTLGEILCGLKDYGAAIRLHERARALHPDSGKFLNGLGVSLHGAGRREEAAACFAEAVERAPDFKDGYFNLAVTLLELRRKDDAIARLDAALKRWPDASDLAELRRRLTESQPLSA
jgi:tetratricopeptide (TPR) repeat protein